MTDAGRSRKLRYVTVNIVPLRSLVLALFLTLGVLLGYAASARYAGDTSGELRRYFDGYLALAAAREISPGTVAQTLACFFRASVIAFLLGFASIGVIALPLLCLTQGFVLSFSLFSFACAMGRGGFAALIALFAVRLLFVLPCTFLLSSAALEKSRELALLSVGSGRRVRPVVYAPLYWYRFAVCCVCLLIGSVLELWLTPLLLAARGF